MPIANVIRIMRKTLPPHAKISDDAKETIQECVSEYISFITSEANDRCQREQRKTITAEDVLWAMSKLGFDDYIEPLTVYLHRYREFDGGERGSPQGRAPAGEEDGRPSSRHHGVPRFPPAFHQHGSSSPPPRASLGARPMSFFKDAANPGSSQACVEPFPSGKEQQL
ncbi:nuclear transcription factor y subunit b-6 [Phtheirospermum japonicum]|uniref:Nuclear transcription factor y subunit b-6 n=1 Tax=Phtheirospermum japonicum TaxID=374723 RepID=A0A830C8U7_9LAMI|nr:nuclear transcription factor y subunit b-6 [Phtheirospermum japonicum]